MALPKQHWSEIYHLKVALNSDFSQTHIAQIRPARACQAIHVHDINGWRLCCIDHNAHMSLAGSQRQAGLPMARLAHGQLPHDQGSKAARAVHHDHAKHACLSHISHKKTHQSGYDLHLPLA